LTPLARPIGLIDDFRWDAFERRRDRFTRNQATLDGTLIRSPRGDRQPASQVLRQPEIRLQALVDDGSLTLDLDSITKSLDIASLETAIKYEGYLKQEQQRVVRVRQQEERRIPDGFPFARVPGLSREVVHRLASVRPRTLGQASRVPGVTPAAVAVLNAFLGRLSPDAPAPAP
jgi:tRNA uridine 5-carboxymethylaminomethyl modification enzyme